jgi:predicted metal-dependent HD superfamily phosphohydrolase
MSPDHLHLDYKHFFEQSWQRAWSNLDLPAPDTVFAQLIAAYNESHRHYHTRQHLQECLQHFSDVVKLANHPGEVELALWFHDAVYALKANDNERRSANWAQDVLQQAGATMAQQQRVVRLIMATCHDVIPVDADEQLLVDIDLAILGASPERFAEYDQQVRAEYDWVPRLIYRMKRKAVLRGFLDRSPYNWMRYAPEKQKISSPAWSST